MILFFFLKKILYLLLLLLFEEQRFGFAFFGCAAGVPFFFVLRHRQVCLVFIEFDKHCKLQMYIVNILILSPDRDASLLLVVRGASRLAHCHCGWTTRSTVGAGTIQRTDDRLHGAGFAMQMHMPHRPKKKMFFFFQGAMQRCVRASTHLRAAHHIQWCPASMAQSIPCECWCSWVCFTELPVAFSETCRSINDRGITGSISSMIGQLSGLTYL